MEDGYCCTCVQKRATLQIWATTGLYLCLAWSAKYSRKLFAGRKTIILKSTRFSHQLKTVSADGYLVKLPLMRLPNLLYTAIVTIDYTQAFDVISFNHLLNALSSASFGSDMIAWFSSMLCHRQALVLMWLHGSAQCSVIGKLWYWCNCMVQLLPAWQNTAYKVLQCVIPTSVNTFQGSGRFSDRTSALQHLC